MKLHCNVLRGGIPHPLGPQVFDQDVIKIGSLGTSTLVLEGIGKMHAVLERTRYGVWCVIDLGTSLGTKLNGVFVDGSTEIGSSGLLEFGPWHVFYETTDASDAYDSREHHRGMYEALIKEVRKHHGKTADLAQSTLKSWKLCDDSRKRNLIRLLVSALREFRNNAKRSNQSLLQIAEKMAGIGLASFVEIYQLEPAQALAQARTVLFSFAQTKAAIAALNEIKRNAATTKDTDDEETREHNKHFIQGIDNLEAMLQQEVVSGVPILFTCLSRAGGYALTPAGHAKLHQAFEDIEKGLQEAAAASPEDFEKALRETIL